MVDSEIPHVARSRRIFATAARLIGILINSSVTFGSSRSVWPLSTRTTSATTSHPFASAPATPPIASSASVIDGPHEWFFRDPEDEARHVAQKLADIINTAGVSVAGRFGLNCGTTVGLDMSRRLRSTTRVAELRRIFRSDEKRLIDAYIARLCVLYEDLRIELFAISADSIPRLDILDPADENSESQNIGKYRRNYFLRRSVGTLYEFAEGLRLLAKCTEFSELMATFDTETAELWKRGIDFFRSKEQLIRDVRHDIGGHFGSKAAIYAVRNLSPKVGKIEFRYDVRNLPSDPRLHFAGEIAASAFLRHLPGVSVEQQVGGFIKNVLVEGYRHAANCVQIILVLHLWPRFGR
jgi:hypothetical protein